VFERTLHPHISLPPPLLPPPLSLYLVIETKAVSVLSGAALGLGVVDAAMGLLLVCCGTRSVFYLRLYAMVIGLLELAQITIAALFLTPDTQQKIITTLDLPADVLDKVENNLNVTGYILIGVVSFQAVSLLLVFLQQFQVDRGFDESNVDEEALLGSSGGYLSSFGYGKAAKRDAKRGGMDKFGALEDENEGAASASTRYKDRNSKYYSKYGLR
jgi:hypothetical protein